MPTRINPCRIITVAATVFAAMSISAHAEADFDDIPQAQPAYIQVDEGDLFDGPINITDALAIDFGLDGPGNVLPNNYFTTDTLPFMSGGEAVTVTLSGSTYTGATNSHTAFAIDILTDGGFSYTHFEPLEHNGTNPVGLTFGTRVFDFDGDSVIGLINVEVLPAVPEPGSLALWVLGGLSLLRRRSPTRDPPRA